MNPKLSNPSRKSRNNRKNPGRKFGIVALIGLAALAWTKLDTNTSTGTSAAGAPDIECNARDPLSRCARTVELGYPLGYGLVFTPVIDEFF
jgi:hypothetical protein